MVIVSLEGGFMEFIPKEKTETMLFVIDFKKTTGIYSETNIFEVYDDLEIKEILYLSESPIKISKPDGEYQIDVSVSSIEDENLPLLYQLSRSTML